jgi:hypothetical protein
VAFVIKGSLTPHLMVPHDKTFIISIQLFENIVSIKKWNFIIFCEKSVDENICGNISMILYLC